MKKRISLIVVVVYIFSCIMMPVSANTLESTKKQQDQVKKEISKIEQDKKNAEAGLDQSKKDKAYYDALAKKEQTNLNQAKDEVTQAQEDINRILGEIDDIEKNYENKTELFKTRMRVMYQNMNRSSLEVLIESKSLSEVFSRIQLLSLVKENDEKLLKEISTVKENTELQKQTKLLELKEKTTQLENLNVKVTEIKTSRAKIESEIEMQTARLKSLEKKEDEMIALSKQLEKKVKDLMDMQAKYSEGAMKWPTPGYTRISSPYGMRIHPVYKVKKMHTGIDIDAPSGANIIAANSGKVIMAGWNGGYGNCVIIDHGEGIATLYAHQSKILVSVGQMVKKGDTIGKVGSTGLSTGPHLHFEVRVKGETKDPRKYV